MAVILTKSHISISKLDIHGQASEKKKPVSEGEIHVVLRHLDIFEDFQHFLSACGGQAPSTFH